MRLTSARLGPRGLTVAAAMGAWHSEVSLDRRDLPLAAGLAAVLLASFTLGRLTASRTR